MRSLTEWTVNEAPENAVVVDYMCGTGWLLHALSQARPDLVLSGCDVSKEYVEYGQTRYPELNLEVSSALQYQPVQKPHLVICAAGIHHLNPVNQELFIMKVNQELRAGGCFVVGEEVLRDWTNEHERKNAVLELSTAVLQELFAAAAPEEQIEAALEVLRGDLLRIGEFKSSLGNLLSSLQVWFEIERVRHIWPSHADPFGDYLIFAKHAAR
ncbi:MAG: Methyltransferase domain [Verrucomicrobiota bacterium]|jgi:trans-aconitate methyltransferase